MFEFASRPATDGLLVTVAIGGTEVVVRGLVERMDDTGACGSVPIERVERSENAISATGSDAMLSARLSLRRVDGFVDVELEAQWVGQQPGDTGLRFVVHMPGRVSEPRWLVPGCFYRENRPSGTAVRYPRAVVSDGDLAAFESAWWSFRSDRAATSAVFGWTSEACVGLTVDPVTSVGMTGVGFSTGSVPRIWVDLPYREEPVVYRGEAQPSPPEVTTHRWMPGERHTFRMRLSVGPADPHGYIPLLRECYRRDRAKHAVGPWMGAAEAAELAAHGLHRWHWHPEHNALYETAAFDRADPGRDRASMHVAWISGIPWAHALLLYGRTSGVTKYVDAGERVIDHVCAQLTPAGTFWGEWRRGRGWGCGWNRNADWLHARTLAEATLFALRAVRCERARGVDRPRWATVAVSNLRHAVGSQDRHGNLGSYYHYATGEVVGRAGAAGLLWIAALAEGASVLDHPPLLDTARRAGLHYAQFVEDAFVNGAPEDVHLAPTSEDAYNALIAYVSLHRVDPDNRWLDLARLAADWMMTFRWSYNIEFDEHTVLRHYRFRTRGADNASPPNQHLHAYGLIAIGELVELWRLTDDPYYVERAQDNLACFLQMVARADGDLDAGKGMVTERYYHTDCFQPKGSILTLSHAWSAGVLLHACQVALANPDAFPPSRHMAADRVGAPTEALAV